MKTLTKTAKLADKLIEASFYRHGTGVQINVMDIGKIFQAGRAALAAGADLDSAVIQAIAQYRQN